MDSIQDSVGATDKAVIGMASKVEVKDSFKAPAFKIGIVCHGPDEADRAQYLNLREREDLAYRVGDIELALSLGDEARALIREQWREEDHNLVTTAGKTDILDKYLKGSAYTAAWYLILCGSGTKAAADTLASHGGWSEITAYAGNRPAITWGSTSAGSNTATAVVVTMNAGYTVAGAGISSVNSGTSGTLYNAADFGTARSGGSGDTLTVTMTETVS